MNNYVINNKYSKDDCEKYLMMKCDKNYYTRDEIINYLNENNIPLIKLTKLDKIIERKNEIQSLFSNNKLEFKNHGDCFLYINYGKPPIENILNDELEKIQTKNSRRMKLAKKLSDYDIEFEENNKLCYEYINNIGCNGINEIVRLMEIENFFKKTNKKSISKSITLNFD